MIGQRNLIAGHRGSNGQHRLHRVFRRRRLGQISLNRIGQRWIVVERVDMSGAGLAAGLHQRKARVGGADIADQTETGNAFGRQCIRYGAVFDRTHARRRALSFSAAATCSFTAMKLSGLTDMESIPQRTRNSANSG